MVQNKVARFLWATMYIEIIRQVYRPTVHTRDVCMLWRQAAYGADNVIADRRKNYTQQA